MAEDEDVFESVLGGDGREAAGEEPGWFARDAEDEGVVAREGADVCGGRGEAADDKGGEFGGDGVAGGEFGVRDGRGEADGFGVGEPIGEGVLNRGLGENLIEGGGVAAHFGFGFGGDGGGGVADGAGECEATRAAHEGAGPIAVGGVLGVAEDGCVGGDAIEDDLTGGGEPPEGLVGLPDWAAVAVDGGGRLLERQGGGDGIEEGVLCRSGSCRAIPIEPSARERGDARNPERHPVVEHLGVGGAVGVGGDEEDIGLGADAGLDGGLEAFGNREAFEGDEDKRSRGGGKGDGAGKEGLAARIREPVSAGGVSAERQGLEGLESHGGDADGIEAEKGEDSTNHSRIVRSCRLH